MDPATREQARNRAGARCEYCHLPAAHVVVPFQIEHIIARQHRGRDTLAKLARTGKVTRLFNPRRQLWSRHFRWQGAALVGKTAVGRTTIEVLAMNDPARLALRAELLAQGLLPHGAGE